MEELVPLMKEAIDRKADNPRRRKRRDILRLSLLRILLYMANNGIFARWWYNISATYFHRLEITPVELMRF